MSRGCGEVSGCAGGDVPGSPWGALRLGGASVLKEELELSGSGTPGAAVQAQAREDANDEVTMKSLPIPEPPWPLP